MVARLAGRAFVHGDDVRLRQTDRGLKPLRVDGCEELQLLRVPEHRPRQPARPRAEWRIPLLRRAAAELPVVAVEDRLVRRPATDVIGVAGVTVKQDVLARA